MPWTITGKSNQLRPVTSAITYRFLLQRGLFLPRYGLLPPTALPVFSAGLCLRVSTGGSNKTNYKDRPRYRGWWRRCLKQPTWGLLLAGVQKRKLFPPTKTKRDCFFFSFFFCFVYLLKAKNRVSLNIFGVVVTRLLQLCIDVVGSARHHLFGTTCYWTEGSLSDPCRHEHILSPTCAFTLKMKMKLLTAWASSLPFDVFTRRNYKQRHYLSSAGCSHNIVCVSHSSPVKYGWVRYKVYLYVQLETWFCCTVHRL